MYSNHTSIKNRKQNFVGCLGFKTWVWGAGDHSWYHSICYTYGPEQTEQLASEECAI